MSTFKCKMCGGTLEIQNGSTVAECEYCGAKQTLPKLGDEKRVNLYDRANHFRRSNEFDKASAIYEQILNEDNTDSEAYWSLVLCRYGIEYVEDPLSHRRVPTVHRAQFTSIFDDDNYKLALKNADSYQRTIYEEEAKAINEIQKGILAISQKEEPFDVFICYKETDNSGKRTHDSVLAQDLYYQLKQEGFKVFFARITLEDKLGTAYEPYIFAALNSAKVMVVIGTQPEHFNAVWVKNEWSRFLSLIKNGEKKMLIPAYKDMDPYDLPKEFSHLQAQDMSKLGFMQDLLRGIKKILGRDKKPAISVTERVVVNGEGHDAAPLLRRAFIFLEDGEFDNADEYAEKVLDINPECAEAYVVKLLVELQLKKPSELAGYKVPISDSHNYQKAIRFASPEYRETIEGYNNAIIKRLDTARKNELYNRGVELMKMRRYDEASQYFQKITTYKDSAQKVDDCKRMKETERRDNIYSHAVYLLSTNHFDAAAQLFESIDDHKDAKEKIKCCEEKKEAARKNGIYVRAMQRVFSANADDVAIKKSIEELHTISGYSDTDDQIRALNARLDKWYEDKRKAEEAARIRAEEERRTREREAELRRIKTEKNKKTAKKVAKIGIPSIVALAVFLALLFKLIIPLIRYNKAEELFNSGNYTEALEIYNDLKGFSESEQRIAVLNAIDMINISGFEEGIRKILSVGVPVKLTYGMDGGDFSGANYLGAHQGAPAFNTITLGAFSTSSITTVASESGAPETTEFLYNSLDDFVGIQTPGRSGYRFVKWELETYKYQVDGTFEMKLNAIWSEKEYTIIYDLDGGQLSSTNPVGYGIEEDSFTLVNPTKTGYTFIGWTGTGLDALTMSVTIEKGNVGDRSYKANWEANTYTITLNPNGGSVAQTTITATYDQPYTLPEPAWMGHAFSGWYEGNKKVTSGTWTRTSELKLDAKWDAVTYDISYTMNDGTNASSNPLSYTVYDEFVLVAPTRTGYTFIGWTYDGQTTPVLTVTVPVGTIGNKSYTANWVADSFTLTLEANGGSVSHESMTVTYDVEFTLPTPTRIGYTFVGWFDGDNEYTSGAWKTTGNTTLTALWTANSYTVTYDDTIETRENVTVTFDYNYSDSTSAIVELQNGDVLEYPTVPTREGYAFAGWYTTADCTVMYDFSGTITEDITLYAKWIAMTSSYYSREYVDIANYNSSSSKKSVTVSASYSSSQNYYYFTCYKSGTYTFYADHTSGDFYITVYNVTQGTTVINQANLYSSYPNTSVSFTANAGDVIYVRLYKYSSVGSTGKGAFYVTNASYPTSTATASCSTIIGYEYSVGETASAAITFGSLHTLPELTRTGYTFLGWYNGETKVESGSWSIDSNVTLTPRWQAGENVITLDADGGTVSTNSIAVTYDQAYTLPTPTRVGYAFDGWYKGSIEYTSGIWTEFSNVTLVASWRVNEYTLTYDDVINEDGVLIYETESSYVNIVEFDEHCELPIPVRTGYTFGGWYNGTTKIESGTWNIVSDVTLTAEWTANTYTITFDPNGGEVSSTTQTVTYDSAYTLPTPTWAGHTFSGWYDGNSEVASGVWTTTTNLTLTAQWDVDVYYISYNLNGGENASSNPYAYTVNDSFELAAPIRTGYAFLGWTYDGQTTPTMTVSVAAGTTGDISYTANWEIIDYTVTLDANGGDVSSTFITVNYNTFYTLPTPTRTGYIFDGWYSDSTQYSDGTWTELADVTLTALWTANEYTVKYDDVIERNDTLSITFDYNYSDSISTIVELQNGDVLEYPTVPTREGYAFAGWYTTADCTVMYDFSGTITENITLYAKWVSMTSSYYSREYVDIAEYNSFSNMKEISISASSSSSQNYYYFTCYQSGTYTVYANRTSGDFYITVYNVTQGTTVINKDNLYSSYQSTASAFTANAGDVIYVKLYKYSSSSSTGYGAFYVANASYPESTATAENNAVSGLIYDAESSYTDIVEFDEYYELLIPLRTGYTFGGWYNGTTQMESGIWDILSDVTLTAEWTANTYTITFDPNGGEVSSTTQTVTYDSEYTLPIPTRTGYTFVGWYSDSTQYSDGIWQTPNDITLVAVWTANEDIPYIVNHYLQNIYDDGYTIDNDATQNLIGIADSEITPDVKLYTGFISPSTQTVTVAPDGSLVVNYYYDRETYDLTYVTNGGEEIAAQTYRYQQTLVVATPVRTDYTFGGWFTDATLSTAYDIAPTLNADTTIYAYWTEENKPTDFTYSGTSSITVSAYNGTSTTMWIPAYIGGVPVTKISSSAFKNETEILKVTLPNTITSLGYGIFEDCTSIEELTIPFISTSTSSDEKYKVLDSMFAYDTYSPSSSNTHVPTSIKKVTITKQTEIPSRAFYDCQYIEEINIPTTTTGIGSYAFYRCSALIRLNSEVDGVFNIPEGVTEIKSYAFTNCLLVETINLGESVVAIRSHAFDGCKSLTSFVIPAAMETIESYAFNGCISILKINSSVDGELNISSSVTTIGSCAFQGLAGITNVTLPDTITSLGYGIFEDCTSIEELTIPFISTSTSSDEKYKVLDSMFAYDTYSPSSSNTHVPTSIKKVTITKQTEIPSRAFYDCQYIEEINIPTTTTGIGSYAFYRCSALVRLNSEVDGVFNIPEGVTEIKTYTFYNCLLAEVINIGESVITINDYAFANCSSIKKFNSANEGEMVIPESVRDIKPYTFSGNVSITKLVIHDSMHAISTNAFKGCTSLDEVILPFVGTRIDTETEYYTVFGAIFGYNTGSIYNHPNQNYDIPTSIKKVTITAQTVIPEYAFRNCNFIETIILPSNVTSTGANSFYGCTATVSYTYNATASIWNGADVSSSFAGCGTSVDPYQINSAADLAYLASSVNAGESYAGKYFVLNTNINLNSKSWTPIGAKNTAFSGTFDGNGKKIYNISVTMNTAYAGLFGNVSGTIKNLGIISGSLAPASQAGTTYVGPLVAYLTGNVENCYSQAAVTANITNIIYAGGLIGHVDTTATVKDSYASGHISAISSSAFAYAGGFVGANKGAIEGCLAFGDVTAKGSNDTYSRNGGFAANNDGTLTECYRNESQILTKYTTAGDAYCDDGTVDSYSDMISYAQTNWSSLIWEYDLKYPNHK